MQLHELQQKNFSFLGQNARLQGQFTFAGMIKLSCHMTGELTILPNGYLTIEREGLLEGVLHCEDVEIFGQFKGELKSTGKVIIRPSGEVQGKIESRSLVIYPGAQVNMEGHSEEI